jgi:hypothetical protein
LPLFFSKTQVKVDISQPFLLLLDFLCLLALSEHIYGSVLCQRLVELDGILVFSFFFFEGIASSSISFGILLIVFSVLPLTSLAFSQSSWHLL